MWKLTVFGSWDDDYTRSLTKAQNEEVLEAVLAASNGEVEVGPCTLAASAAWPCTPGGVVHTLRFDPHTSKTSGLFVACLHKPLHSAA